MFFSVVVPVFNRPEPLKNAIQSILNQDHQDWECIIVDDGSTDNTAQICSDFAAADSRIHFYPLKSNRGVSAARNYGLDHVSTRDGYILFLDSDDCFKANAMSTISEILEQNDLDMIVFAFDPQGLPFNPPYYQVFDRTKIRSQILPQHLNILPHAAGFLMPYVCNKAFKKSLIMNYNIRFDEWRRTWEDNAFVIQCLDKCSNLMIIPDRLFDSCDYAGLVHLSGHIDSDLFFTYIAGYEKNVKQFGTEFCFDSEYTSRHFFDVVHGLLISYYAKCSEAEFLELLEKLQQNETIQSWVNSITPKDRDEASVISAFQTHDSSSLFHIYQYQSMQKSKPSNVEKSLSGNVKALIRKTIGNDRYEKIKNLLSLSK